MDFFRIIDSGMWKIDAVRGLMSLSGSTSKWGQQEKKKNVSRSAIINQIKDVKWGKKEEEENSNFNRSFVGSFMGMFWRQVCDILES